MNDDYIAALLLGTPLGVAGVFLLARKAFNICRKTRAVSAPLARLEPRLRSFKTSSDATPHFR